MDGRKIHRSIAHRIAPEINSSSQLFVTSTSQESNRSKPSFVTQFSCADNPNPIIPTLVSTWTLSLEHP